MPVAVKTRTELIDFEVTPLFVDYDFAGKRPRGGSAFIDFFSFGKLCEIMDSCAADSKVVYVQKKNMLPKGGFFLIDFAKTSKELEGFRKLLDDMRIERAYLEVSAKYPIDCANAALAGITFLFARFSS